MEEEMDPAELDIEAESDRQQHPKKECALLRQLEIPELYPTQFDACDISFVCCLTFFIRLLCQFFLSFAALIFIYFLFYFIFIFFFVY